MFCEKCGARIEEGMKFCVNCGAPITQQVIQKEEKVHKQSNWKWIIGGIAGTAVLLFAVAVGIMYAMGVFGSGSGDGAESEDKWEVAETMKPAETKSPTPTPTPQPTETPQPTATVQPDVDEQQAEEEEEYDEGEYDEGEYDDEVASTEATPVSMEDIYQVEASSELSERGMTHSADRICDGSLNSAWVEGVSGQGIGENVQFIFDDIHYFSGMKIYAGYQKSKELYYKNSRPKEIEIAFAHGGSKSFKLKDRYGMQQIDFDEQIVSYGVTVTIKSVYKGKKYKDTVISEIEWY